MTRSPCARPAFVCGLARRVAWSLVVAAAAWALLALFATDAAHAAPASPHVSTTQQPDGTRFRSRAFGDEWAHGVETVEGYTVVRRANGVWEYAARGADNRLRGSGRVVGRDRPGRLPKHLRDEAQMAQGAALADTAALPDSTASEPSTVAASSSLLPPATTHRSLVLLVSFRDQAPVQTTAAQWNDRFFGASGSLKDYYEEVSYSAFTVAPAAESDGTPDDGVVGWLPLNMNHPKGDMEQARLMVKAAVLAADASVDFAAYDTNGDNILVASELHVTVIAAGYEAAYGDTVNAIWAHRWALSGTVPPPVVDGKSVTGGRFESGYTTFGEMHGGHQATVGIVAHEFGHDIGWPDLYDTDPAPSASSSGVGNWSVMGGGSWLQLGTAHHGSTPAHPEAWSKWFQGWITPGQVDAPVVGHAINAASSLTNSNVALQVRDNPAGPTDWRFMGQRPGVGEYFLVENRQRTPGTFDEALPGDGLLVWHIDETQEDNATDASRLVDLEEADGLGQLDMPASTGLRGDAGDPYPGTADNRSFSSTSNPHSRLNTSNTYSGVTLEQISASGPTMTADVFVPPANDAFAAATTIGSQTFSATQRLSEATRQASEPAACAVDRSLWFAYTPSHDVTVTVNTSGGAIGTALGVFTGSGMANLARVVCHGDNAADATTSAVSFSASAGTTYYIQAGNEAAATGSIGDLTVSLTARPRNDDLARAQAITGGWGTIAATNVAATKQPGEPNHGAGDEGAGGSSVWYSWTAPAAQKVAFATSASAPFTPLLAVYQGDALEDLAVLGRGAIGSAGVAPDRRVEFVAVEGQTYRITVDGTRSLDGTPSAGLFGLTWSVTATRPGAPQEVTATRGHESATVAWAVPASDGDSPVTSYTVTSTPGAHTVTVTASVLQATVPGLTNGTSYSFTVKALNEVGSGAGATSNSVIPATAPAPVTNVRAERADAAATVTWTPPTSDGASAITGYIITSNPDGRVAHAGPSTTRAVVADLTNGTAYTFTVVATNGVGRSDASQESNSITPSTLPAQARAVTAISRDSAATVTWAPPASNGGAAITAYTVRALPGPQTATVVAPATTATITGLSNGTPYTFTVTSVNAIGVGEASAESAAIIPAGPPSAPTKVTAVRGNGSATVAWTGAQPNGAPITSYTVTPTGGGQATVVEAPTTSITITGLTDGTPYTFTVTGTNAAGTGAASQPSMTETTPPTVTMRAPKNRSGTASTLTIAWASTDASGVAWHDVRSAQAAPNGDFGGYTAPADWQRRVGNKVILEGTRPGHRYCFEVRSTDVAGNASAWARRCTVTMDDTALAASGSWTNRKSDARYFGGTYRWTTKAGATLASPTLTTKQLSLVATTCATCGTVKVTYGSVSKTITLSTARTKRQQVLPIATFKAAKSVRVSVVVASRRKPVEIDGLAVATP